MDETKRQDVGTMTAEEVRREIAELLGYKSEAHPQYPHAWARIIDPDGLPVRADRNADGWVPIEFLWSRENLYPNWPGDDGAAIRLVFDVLDRLNTQTEDGISRGSQWEFRVTPGDVNFCEFGFLLGHEWDSINVEGRDALALSKLALLALRELAVNDG